MSFRGDSDRCRTAPLPHILHSACLFRSWQAPLSSCEAVGAVSPPPARLTSSCPRSRFIKGSHFCVSVQAIWFIHQRPGIRTWREFLTGLTVKVHPVSCLAEALQSVHSMSWKVRLKCCPLAQAWGQGTQMAAEAASTAGDPRGFTARGPSPRAEDCSSTCIPSRPGRSHRGQTSSLLKRGGRSKRKC